MGAVARRRIGLLLRVAAVSVRGHGLRVAREAPPAAGARRPGRGRWAGTAPPDAQRDRGRRRHRRAGSQLVDAGRLRGSRP
ncbi:hypothetical protein G6F59_018120 [Rhizopus arrhizus]|nr:hypothetical protein G6F59_018120 [Rhizopus arrhizus]